MEPLWTHLQLAEFLNKSPHSIRGMVSRGQVPYLKIGRSCRFDPEAIKEWLNSHERQPKPRRGAD